MYKMTVNELVRYWRQKAIELDQEANEESPFASCSLSGNANGLLQAAKDLENVLKDQQHI
jgi:hypothetical protein